MLLAEKRSTTAHQRLNVRLQQRLMQGSRWAERADPIGLEEVIQSASAEQLDRFHRRWYQPQSLAVVALGVFDPAAMRRRVEQHFGSLKKPESPSRPSRFDFPVSAAAEHVVLVAAPELPGTTSRVLLKRPRYAFTTEQDYRWRLMDQLLAGMLQKRLESSARAPDAPLSGVSAVFQLGDAGTCATLQLNATTQLADAGRALGQLIGELGRVAREGFHAAELERARPALALAFPNLVTQSFRSVADQLVGHFLTGETVIAAPVEVELRERLLASISLEELNQAGGPLGTAESLKEAALLLLTELARTGAAPEQVEALRKQVARGAELAPTKTGFWLQELGNAYRRDLDPAQIVATVTNRERISSAALQASARRYLQLDQYVDALLVPAGQTSTAAAPAVTL